MNTQIQKIDPKEFGLDEQNVQEIEKAFLPKIAEREGYAEIYGQIITKELTVATCAEASELRKKLVKVRTGIAEIHKTQKAFFLSAGRFVDAWKNKETIVIEQMEENLSQIENHFINIEKEKAAALKSERIAVLSEVCDNPELYQVELMTEQAFLSLVEGQRLIKEKRIADEKASEEARLAAIEAQRIENERIRKENEALRLDAIEQEKQAAIERKKAAEDLAAIEAKAKAERERAEAEKAKAEAEANAKLEVERKERERVESELKRKQAEDLAAKQVAEKLEADRKAAEAKAAKAPDKDKMKVFVSGIILPALPSLSSDESKTKLSEITEKFEAFKRWAVSQIESI